MIKFQAKRFELNFLSKLSDLKSNSMLNQGHLNPDLNNAGQGSFSSIGLSEDGSPKKKTSVSF